MYQPFLHLNANIVTAHCRGSMIALSGSIFEGPSDLLLLYLLPRSVFCLFLPVLHPKRLTSMH